MRALSEQPLHSDARRWMGACYLELDDYEHAQIELKQVFDESLSSLPTATGVDFIVAMRDVRQNHETVDETGLTDDQRKLLLQVARKHAGAAEDWMRAHAFKLGLWLGRREFVGLALELCRQPTLAAGIMGEAMRWHHETYQDEDFAAIEAVVRLRPRPFGRPLVICIAKNACQPEARAALLRLMQSHESWLWWHAAREGLYYDQGRALLKQIVREHPELRPRIFAVVPAATLYEQNETGRPEETEVRAAKELLVRSLTPELYCSGPYTWGRALASINRRLDRQAGTQALIRFLRSYLKKWDSIDDPALPRGTPIVQCAKQLNRWHGVHIGGLGQDIR